MSNSSSSGDSEIGLLLAALITSGILNAWLFKDYVGLLVLAGAIIVGLWAARAINGD